MNMMMKPCGLLSFLFKPKEGEEATFVERICLGCWVVQFLQILKIRDRGKMDKMTASATTTTTTTGSSIFTNYPLLSALIAFALAQSIKLFTSWYKERRWDLKQLVGSGGMPSSHSSTVTALAVAVGLQEGFGGPLFACALVLACVVMYDATGVRLQAGRQAEVLNQILYELPSEHPLADSRPLRELLGHTPPQVIAGGLLGLTTATVIHFIAGSAFTK